MSQPTPGSSAETERGNSDSPDRVLLFHYPKIIFLYPTLIMSLIAGTTTWYYGLDGQLAEVMGSLMLGVFAINMVVFSFDFPRATSLTLFFFGAAVVMGLLLLFRLSPDTLPFLAGLVHSFKPKANPTFYFTLAGIWIVLYCIMLVTTRFDYWEVRPNELLHHHGILSDLKRYPAQHLRVEKEINDLFEYLLLGSGRLILKPPNEPRPIVLDNVLFITHKEEALTKLLGALQVQVRD